MASLLGERVSLARAGLGAEVPALLLEADTSEVRRCLVGTVGFW